MSNKSFGLDIGQSSIKMVSLSPKKGGYSLESSFIIPAPSKGMVSESILDQQEMADAIKKALDNAKINTKDVNIALPENKVYTKVIEMPVLSDRELSSAIYWEAEQYIPVPLSSVNLVWSVLRRPVGAETNENMTVLMVGAPTSIIDKYQKILSIANLNIVSVETEILSVIRALIYKGDQSREENLLPTIIVNIGSVSTSLAILRDNVLVFTYSVPIGGATISRSIETEFTFSPQQAEEYKKTYGLLEEGAGQKIGKAIEPILEIILNEVRKAVVFYSQKYKDASLRQVILAGGSARLAGIDLFFTKNLNIETVIANPWKVLINQQLPQQIISQATDYTAAVGLAMKGYE